jgi:hypothetical protein
VKVDKEPVYMVASVEVPAGASSWAPSDSTRCVHLDLMSDGTVRWNRTEDRTITTGSVTYPTYPTT